jgi:hypothetical protein
MRERVTVKGRLDELRESVELGSTTVFRTLFGTVQIFSELAGLRSAHEPRDAHEPKTRSDHGSRPS